jgi:IclR family transcriptional regulator, acetate operon repressor
VSELQIRKRIRERPALQSVERAMDVLEAFSADHPEWGVNELSRELGLHRTILSRLATTLASRGLLVRLPDSGRYRLGARLIAIAAQVTTLMGVREVARPYLKELAEACGETVSLCVLEGTREIDLEQIAPTGRMVLASGWLGRRAAAAHCTASGKCLLAFLPASELDFFLKGDLETFTEQTIVDPDALRAELQAVRENGYATAFEELEIGLNAVAAPVFNHLGSVVCSVGIAGPAYRLSHDVAMSCVARLRDTTLRISQGLGWFPVRSAALDE